MILMLLSKSRILFTFMESKIKVGRAKLYYCPACDTTYKKNEVWFNGWISKWCPKCFRAHESMGYCELLVKEVI